MFEIRIHGRAGQGVVTAAELLSAAAFAEGKYAPAFPSFGSERTGAPVVSFCRSDDKPIRVREPVMHPDVLIFLAVGTRRGKRAYIPAGDSARVLDAAGSVPPMPLSSTGGPGTACRRTPSRSRRLPTRAAG
jgi:Pyruvate ferredoxin/flavodoxin oxidoreductase